MHTILSNALRTIILFLVPLFSFAQGPVIGTAAKFVLFTTNGAMTCSGTKYLTHLTGDVGSDLPGSVTGFGNVDGVMHVFDVETGAATADVVSLYTQLSTSIPTGTLSSPFGGGIILAPGVYSIPTAATLTGDLILDAGGDPGAIFIFQIGGVLSTNALTKVKLLNGAMACNVFWQVGGAVNVGTGTFMRGTIVANGQIDLTSTLDTLEGRALAMNAPVLVSQLVAYTPIGCGSPYLTGPAAPALASTAAYGVFSSIGAVTSTPVTYVIGDVGANSTTPTGFVLANITGSIHAMDPSTVAAAADLTNVYNYLVALPADINLLDPANLGHDLVLTPHSYQITGITQLTGSLILNAQGNPNAIFVIKINGSFTTGAISKIVLTNGTQAKNVYWKIDGAVDIFSNSVFNGTLVVAGAITLNTGDTLNGRAMTINGAIAINGSYVNITPSACVAAPITGNMTVCEGSTTTLSDADPAGTWESSNTAIATIGSASGIVSGIAAGTTVIKYTTTLACEATTTVTVNPSPGIITGANNVCTGSATTLSDAITGGTWSSSNPLVASVGSANGIVTGIGTGNADITYSLGTGCVSTKTISVNTTPSAGTITGSATVCPGSTTTLSNAISGGIWTSANTAIATVGSVSGTVNGVAAGTTDITYTITNSCGTAFTTKTMTVGALPNAGTITGASTVCQGSTTTLSNATSGGVWTSANPAIATVGTASGAVTGVTTGTTDISYTTTNSCGTASITKSIIVNAIPTAGVITGASTVCQGSTTTLSNAISGGVWTSANTAIATVGSVSGTVTGVAAGATDITYTNTNSCGTAFTTKTMTVGVLPNAGTITGTSTVCQGSTTALSNATSGGVWTSANPAIATIGSASGTVTGVAAGATDITYTITNSCGTAFTTKTINIGALPNAGTITGSPTVCEGSTTTLSNATSGGVWTSANTAIATIGSASGMVTGVAAGMDTISYSMTNTCGTATTTKTIIVNPMPDAGTISGPGSVCDGSSITLTDIAPGGVWSSSNANATVTGGIVTGITSGIAIISYSVTNSCGTASATKAITINPLPNAGTITGPSGVCIGSTITLSNATTGGVWSSSNTRATVTGGVVTGITSGIDTIMYQVTNVCGTATATKIITVNQLPAIPVISIQSPSTVCSGTMYMNFGTATLPVSGTHYTWTATNATVWAQGTAHQNALITFNNTGTAYVSLHQTMTGTGCTSKATVTVNVSTSIAELPIVRYFNNHFVCTPNTEDSYQWGYDDIHSLDSTILTGEINQDYLNMSPDFANKAYWAMTVSGGCLQKTYYRVPTSVQYVTTDAVAVTVYPNPANTFINVAIASSQNGNIQIDLINSIGQKMSSVQTADNKVTIDVATLPAGMYLISCYKDGIKIATSRFVKN